MENEDTSPPFDDTPLTIQELAQMPPDIPREEHHDRSHVVFPKMKDGNFKKIARKDVRAMQKRMQYIATNPRGKDDKGSFLNHEDLVEVLQCNEALFVILSRLLKL